MWVTRGKEARITPDHKDKVAQIRQCMFPEVGATSARSISTETEVMVWPPSTMMGQKSVRIFDVLLPYNNFLTRWWRSWLLVVRKVLLNHTANLAIGIEVLADHPSLIKRTANLLGSAAKCTIRCKGKDVNMTLSEIGRIGHTIEHWTDGSIFREHAVASPSRLFACSGLSRRQSQ